MPNTSMLPFRKPPTEQNLGDWGALTIVSMVLHPLGFGGVYMVVFWVCLIEFVPAAMPHGATNLSYFKMMLICSLPRWIVFWAPWFFIPKFVVEAIRLTVFCTIAVWSVMAISNPPTTGAFT